MRRLLPVLTLTLVCAASARAQGVLVPTQADVPPLAMRSHEVHVTVEDQVAVTKVVQTFRNDTDRQLEATYLFPVPKGASVRKFVMWVDGKEVPGELVEADKARQIYTDIVRRTQDPGLLEYVGNNLLRVRVFPVLGPRRAEARGQLHLGRRQRHGPGRVRLPAARRREIGRRAGEVHTRRRPQGAAPGAERLQPDAPDHREPRE
jgi:hypothetical protein